MLSSKEAVNKLYDPALLCYNDDMSEYRYFNGDTKHPYELKACYQCGVVSWIQKRNNFCSQRCSKLGTFNPFWKGDEAKPTSARMRAHRLVIDRSVCGRCGLEGLHHRHHRDGNTYNNDLENLEILCEKCHGKHHGWGNNHSQGSKHPRAKITEDDVVKIRQRYLNGEKPKVISADYPIDPSGISNIVAHRTWRHVKNVSP